MEDDPNDVKLLEQAFEDVGFSPHIEVASNGDEALERLHGSDPYDLVLLDLNLPGLSGFEVLEAIKSHPRVRETVIVVMSTSSRAEDVTAAYARHANAYVVKPSDFEALTTLVWRLHEFWFGAAELAR